MDELLKEGRAIQSRIHRTLGKHMENEVARTFANLMFEGKTKHALQLLSDKGRGSILKLDEMLNTNSVRELLKSKHPASLQHPGVVYPRKLCLRLCQKMQTELGNSAPLWSTAMS